MIAHTRTVRGFTIVELMIVVIITGILTMFGVPLYREYTLSSMATEGRALLRSISVKQRLYYSDHHKYYGALSEGTAVAKGGNDTVLKVNALRNRYFRDFKYWTDVTAITPVFHAVTTATTADGRNIKVQVTQSPGSDPIYGTIIMH